MATIEDKFIVLAKKDIQRNSRHALIRPVADELLAALEKYHQLVELTDIHGAGKQFYVCNQDEPYAEEVISVILKGETEKEEG